MAKSVKKHAVTEDQYREACEAYRKNEEYARVQALEKDAQIGAIEAAFAPVFDTYTSEELRLRGVIREFCDANRWMIFGDKMTVKRNGLTLGYKKGSVSVQLCEGREEADVIEAMDKLLPGYVQRKASIDKRKLQSDMAELADKTLERCGIYFERGEESFTVKVEETKPGK